MKSPRVIAFLTICTLLGAGCTGQKDGPQPHTEAAQPQAEEGRSESGGSNAQSIDERSYRLGSIGAFAEMVDAGVKRLALSAPLDPGEVGAIIEDARRIADEHGVGLFLDEDFLVTDLFAPELTEGKHVLVICLESTWNEYLALKDEKLRLEEAGQYVGEARVAIARKFGGLLSYGGEKIGDLLQVRGSSP